MGFYVHCSITFSANSEHIKDIAPVVMEFISSLKEENCKETRWIAEALIELKHYNCGPKGELFTFGFVGNYTQVDKVAEELIPLFENLFKNNSDYIFDHDRVIIFEEREGSEQAVAYELFWSLPRFLNLSPVKLNRHLLPFFWGQY